VKKRLSLCVILAALTASALVADPVRLYEAGRAYQDQEQWYDAIESYQEALQENPSYNMAYQGLAESFYALGEYEEALTQVQKAEAYKRNDPALLDLHGFILVGLGKTAEAAAMFKQVLATWPNDVSARFGVAETEITAGRISAASALYTEALRRNPENRKALLSLALVNQEAGNAAAAREYIAKALQYHGDNPQVFYYAAYLSFADGKLGEAENRARTALSLKPDYDDAREILAAILYRSSRYSEVITLCDERIATDRNRASAWYLKALALEKLSRHEEAIRSAQTGIQVAPEDEILRSLMETIVIDNLKFEDPRRASWASWHVSKAVLFGQKNMSDQGLYEYRRALKINPYDTASREAYAKLLLTRGYPARYVEQLKFIQSLGKGSASVNDAVESYGKLLSNSVPAKWKIDPVYLDKAHIAITFYYQADAANFMHPDSERITAGMIGEVFAYNPGFKIEAPEAPVGSYSEAFRKSREKGDDYFALVRIRENARDVQIACDLYVARTGSVAEHFTVFRTGNDRYANAIRRLVQIMTQAMPVRGTVVNRFQADSVIDLGKADGIKVGQKFDVVPSSLVTVLNEGIGMRFSPEDVLGTFTVTTVDEDVSQGKLERGGFFDRINSGDTVLVKADQGDGTTAGTATGSAGATKTGSTAGAGTAVGTTAGKATGAAVGTASGTTVGKAPTAASGAKAAGTVKGKPVQHELGEKTPPALLLLLRKIR
jgi:tetratricopeptide (TPR) repeat protein